MGEALGHCSAGAVLAARKVTVKHNLKDLRACSYNSDRLFTA
jgi:hypothetical protein